MDEQTSFAPRAGPLLRCVATTLHGHSLPGFGIWQRPALDLFVFWRNHAMARNSFQWDDPFQLDQQLSEDERMIRDAADRKSTRLNSSHTVISYAVFCLKKKKTKS